MFYLCYECEKPRDAECEFRKKLELHEDSTTKIILAMKTSLDLASRTRTLDKFASAGVLGRMLNLVAEILQLRLVPIKVGVGVLPAFQQTTGVARGDNLSPLLFSVLISDLPEEMSSESDLVYTLFCAPDRGLIREGQCRHSTRTRSGTDWSSMCSRRK